MRTSRENGFTFDYGGSHVIFSSDKPILRYILTMLGDDKIRNRRILRSCKKNIDIKYPFENGLPGLSKQDNFECLYYFI